MIYTHIAAYKFISLSIESQQELYTRFLQEGQARLIKGTILISKEGINLMLAGEPEAIVAFKNTLQTIPELQDLEYKESTSDFLPFKRYIVKIKDEVITFNEPNVDPTQFTAPYVAPQLLKAWYEQQQDMLVLDARNHYEVAHGKFVNAIDLNISNFTEFAQAVQQLDESYKNKTIVTYCTGGIRCEKAAAYLIQQGFQKVYQLEGGILSYFSHCGKAFYDGKCFVFDERVAIDHCN